MKLLGHDIVTTADLEALKNEVIGELKEKVKAAEKRLGSAELKHKLHLSSSTIAVIVSVIALVVAILK